MIDDAESAVLDWQGPLDLAAFRALDDTAPMQVPAVYLNVMTYEAKVLVYVGMSKNFLDRFRSHLTATLGLTYWMRDGRGDYAYEVEAAPAFFATLSDPDRLAELQALAAAEIARQRWFFAEIDGRGLPYAEGLLIRHVRALADTGATVGGKPVVSDNGNAGRAPVGALVLENRGADLPCGLLGPAVHWPLEAAA